MFVPQLSLAEILLRGVLIYVGLCLLLRIVLKRQAGKVSLSDLLVVTLVAGICRNPLVADAYSIPDGLGVVAVVLFCSYSVDWLSFYSPIIHRLMHPARVELVRNGQIMQDSLKRELMTDSQLRCQLRHHGVGDVDEVAEAWIESSGEISVIKKADRQLSEQLAVMQALLDRLSVAVQKLPRTGSATMPRNG
jgi:uncharacterized membrane protein YcaP (DUF421 family)